MVVRVKGYGEELGRLDLQVDTEKKAWLRGNGRRLPIDSTKIQPAADVAALVKHWEDEVSARVDQPLAIASKPFTKAEVKKLIERALRDETGADFCLDEPGRRPRYPAEGSVAGAPHLGHHAVR